MAYTQALQQYELVVADLKKQLGKKVDVQDWVEVDFSNIDENGKPPHFLADHGTQERDQAIAKLNFIYEDTIFQDTYKYVVNEIANQSFFKASEENMKYYRYAVLGIKEFYKQFENAHNEFVNRGKENDFDPLSILPD